MKNLNRHLGVAATTVLLSFTGLAGCAGTRMGTGAPMGASSITVPSDKALAATVSKTLQQYPDLQDEEIVVTANNGVITLSGWVQDSDQEARARALASRVPGVAQAYSRIHLWSASN